MDKAPRLPPTAIAGAMLSATLHDADAVQDGGAGQASLAEQASAWGLDAKLVDALRAAGHSRFFPIQSAVIPEVLRAERVFDKTFGDVCISAPTGSGKTLAYVLPVVQVRIAGAVLPVSCAPL